MRDYLLLSMLCFFFSACGPAAAPSPEKAVVTSPNFDWLLGNWQRSDDKPGRTTYEQWTKISATEYAGFSFRMEGQDTTWQEAMRLLAIGQEWVLEASGEGDVVPFTLTEITEKAFVSENPAHDFPQVITYTQRGDSLFAVISGEGVEVPFTFGPSAPSF